MLCIQCATAQPKKAPETLTFSLRANTAAVSETSNDSNLRDGRTDAHKDLNGQSQCLGWAHPVRTLNQTVGRIINTGQSHLKVHKRVYGKFHVMLKVAYSMLAMADVAVFLTDPNNLVANIARLWLCCLSPKQKGALFSLCLNSALRHC